MSKCHTDLSISQTPVDETKRVVLVAIGGWISFFGHRLKSMAMKQWKFPIGAFTWRILHYDKDLDFECWRRKAKASGWKSLKNFKQIILIFVGSHQPSVITMAHTESHGKKPEVRQGSNRAIGFLIFHQIALLIFKYLWRLLSYQSDRNPCILSTKRSQKVFEKYTVKLNLGTLCLKGKTFSHTSLEEVWRKYINCSPSSLAPTQKMLLCYSKSVRKESFADFDIWLWVNRRWNEEHRRLGPRYSSHLQSSRTRNSRKIFIFFKLGFNSIIIG